MTDKINKMVREVGTNLYKPHGHWLGLRETKTKLLQVIAELDVQIQAIEEDINNYGKKEEDK